MIRRLIKLIFALIALTLVGAYLLLWSPLPLVSSWWSVDTYEWNDPLYKRNRIADWLLMTKTLEGLSRTEIEGLLGPANETSYFREWTMVYQLGHERGLISIDSEWLVINLDNSGVATEYQIVRD